MAPTPKRRGHYLCGERGGADRVGSAGPDRQLVQAVDRRALPGGTESYVPRGHAVQRELAVLDRVELAAPGPVLAVVAGLDDRVAAGERQAVAEHRGDRLRRTEVELGRRVGRAARRRRRRRCAVASLRREALRVRPVGQRAGVQLVHALAVAYGALRAP